MIAMCRELGFAFDSTPDTAVLRASLDLRRLKTP
jgi:hypothetical protein